jgi:hypothetical protein
VEKRSRGVFMDTQISVVRNQFGLWLVSIV